MLTTSVAGTIIGLYMLIGFQLREILILSEIKNNQVRANTLAEITAGQIQLESSNVLAAARQTSGMVTNEGDKVINEEFVEPSHLK